LDRPDGIVDSWLREADSRATEEFVTVYYFAFRGNSIG
jgi:hypothetical protein